MTSTSKRSLNLQQIFTWLMEDGILKKEEVKAKFNEAQGLLKNGPANMHPLTAAAQCKLHSAKPPQGLLTLDWLTEWAARKVHLPFYRIDPLKIDFTSVSDVMSVKYATRFNILPVESTAQTVVVATTDPYNHEWQDEIARISRKEIRLVLANPLEISQYIVQFFSLAKSIKDARKKDSANDLGLRQNFEQLVELGKTNKQVDANDQHIVNIVDWLWQFAFDQRASDIHLEPKRDMATIRFRIDGVLHQVYQVPATVMIAMVARIKLLGRIDVIEKRRPQDGRIKTRTADGQEVELRLSTLPTVFGEKMVMRIFDPEVVVKTLPELGFPINDARRWDVLTKKPHGIILVTGPTGSGKTTTLYTTLKALATTDVNVCTVEDPIEMVEASFNQMQVQASIDLSFSDGIRALMRQDPDIIMVGEIRDLETAEMAVQAALTGHLVLSTLHTNDAPSAIMRLLELGVPYYLLEATIIGILAQRLVRTLCRHCKTPDGEITDAVWQSLVEDWGIAKPSTVYRPVGCPECRQTGFLGRTGLYELLTVTQGFSKLITKEADLSALRAQSIKDQMQPLRIAGALKISEGMTTADEVLKVTSALI
ncbi:MULTISPECIES: GspE/PulE family protein [unclassified Undibacterium]|uniref:GspE/PulE family protein n=1 Tax=unclassified Undibacterium TaxID=2630295 RepID=UPI002AC9C7BD|nr:MULTISPECIES: GspE/PulE family protein [unclassified Undibacterium]MEB0138174.1 GspE/PulE family protein [Undibacterium sp. CCC2.1]MEB0171071.1 GspE/PulE family protein [Undibacterium sp. CCC1.1]MEB0175116.1 GspE/PulE family protein [Undibacterium sp. CCC3.4]MEB0214300.1 GspE/PulE family protein [Undibacterium sp. 5I2]WPX41880.1 GspE/PulE family protein [Undibacterium sp. CCC3.4]